MTLAEHTPLFYMPLGNSASSWSPALRPMGAFLLACPHPGAPISLPYQSWENLSKERSALPGEMVQAGGPSLLPRDREEVEQLVCNIVHRLQICYCLAFL